MIQVLKLDFLVLIIKEKDMVEKLTRTVFHFHFTWIENLNFYQKFSKLKITEFNNDWKSTLNLARIS